ELGTRLSVAVLTGKRAAVGDDEICGLVYEVAEFLDAFSGLKVEADAIVRTAVAEVTVHDTAIAVRVGQLAQIAQITSEFVRSNCGILPTFPGCRLSRYARDRAQSGFSYLPSFSCLPDVRKKTKGWSVRGATECLRESARAAFGRGDCIGAKLGPQASSTFGSTRHAFGIS